MGPAPSCKIVEMWKGSRGEEWFPRKWCQHYLLLRFLLLDHWSPLFNDKTDYAATCIWLSCETLNMQSSVGEPERIIKGRFATCFFRAPKLELNLSRISIFPARFHKPSAPSTIFSLRKQKCEAPSLCCLWQDSMFTIDSEILVLNCLGARWWRNHRGPAPAGDCSSLVVCLFLLWMPSEPPFPLLFYLLRWRGRGCHTAPSTSLPCCLALQIFNSWFFLWGGRAGTPVSQLCPDSEDTACCFHYCTCDLHMQGKGGLFNTP